jgi:hypothetical protein
LRKRDVGDAVALVEFEPHQGFVVGGVFNVVA